MTDEEFIRLWNNSGVDVADIAAKMNCQRAIVYRRRKELGLSPRASFAVEYVRELEKRAGQKA